MAVASFAPLNHPLGWIYFIVAVDYSREGVSLGSWERWHPLLLVILSFRGLQFPLTLPMDKQENIN